MPKTRGFSLIDVIVAVALLGIVFVGLMATLRTSIAVSALARAKDASAGVAESQMEYMRGLSYSALGTVGGTPSGVVVANATSTVDGVGYGVHTTILYGDAQQDYKKAEVVVTAYGSEPHSLELVSDFIP
jgi:type II secretory pathway pseudopilin PulG